MSNKYREGELSKLTRRVFYMDLELLKKVVKRVSPLTTTATKIKIEGYTDDEVNQMIQKLIDAGIVTKQKGKKYGLGMLGFDTDGEEIEYYNVFETKLKELNHIDRMGNKIMY